VREQKTDNNWNASDFSDLEGRTIPLMTELFDVPLTHTSLSNSGLSYDSTSKASISMD